MEWVEFPGLSVLSAAALICAVRLRLLIIRYQQRAVLDEHRHRHEWRRSIYGSDHYLSRRFEVLAGDLNAARQRNHYIRTLASTRHGEGVLPWRSKDPFDITDLAEPAAPGCSHEAAIDVHTVPTPEHPAGELVARWCAACETQLDPASPPAGQTPSAP